MDRGALKDFVRDRLQNIPAWITPERMTTVFEQIIDEMMHPDDVGVTDDAALILRPESFGGWARRDIDLVKEIDVRFIGAPSTIAATYTLTRLYVETLPNSSYLPTGISGTLSGASNGLNNRPFWIDRITTEVVSGTTYWVIDVHGGLDVPGNEGSHGSHLGGVTFTVLDKRVKLNNFDFLADGTPNPGVPFSNNAAINAMLDLVHDVSQYERKFAAVIDFGVGAYPSSGGLSLKDRGNIVLRAAGGDHGGIYFLPNALTGKNGMGGDQAIGEPNTQTIHWRDMFLVADDNQTLDYGDDRFLDGSGDLIHMIQKTGSDGSSRATQFDNVVGGVDPQFIISRCRFDGGRNAIALRGRGDCQIDDNKIDGAKINGIALELFDSKVRRNIITTTGENAERYRQGCNNVQRVENHDYFCCDNKAGLLTYAGNTEDEILQRLAVIYVYASNFKSSFDRPEDTTGPAYAFDGRAENVELLEQDFNSIGTIGPTGEGWSYSRGTLPVGAGGEWYGEAGIPAIYVAPGCRGWGGAEISLQWRSGRNQNSVKHLFRLIANTFDTPYRSTRIRIRTGLYQNFTSHPKPYMTEDWAGAHHQFFEKFVSIEDNAGHKALLDNWIVEVDGKRDMTFHTKVLPDADYEVTRYDNNMLLQIPASVERTVTEVVANYPDNFEHEIMATGAGGLVMSGATVVASRNKVPQNSIAKARKIDIAGTDVVHVDGPSMTT